MLSCLLSASLGLCIFSLAGVLGVFGRPTTLVSRGFLVRWLWPYARSVIVRLLGTLEGCVRCLRGGKEWMELLGLYSERAARHGIDDDRAHWVG